MEREPEAQPDIHTEENVEVPDQAEANGILDSHSPVPSFFSRGPTEDVQPEEEPRDSMSAFISRTMAAVGERDDEQDEQNILPRAPRTFGELGLSKAFLTDLTLKIIHYSGAPSMAQLVRRLGLGNDIVTQLVATLTEERLVEIMSQSDLYTGNYKYRLSERGEARVSEALERTRYAGPAPVTAEQYTEVIKSLLEFKQEDSSRARIKSILNDLVLSGEVSDAIARALFSGKSVMIHGPSGNGKTVLLERYAEEMGGFALVPYSIYAYGQVIRVFDPSIHRPLEKFDESNMLRDDSKRDRRWVVVRRPSIVLGAEMDRGSLELSYDPLARFYQAPPHIKAQNGAVIIDDFGRQRMETHDLLTRWLIPLERGWDSLTLVTGEKLVVPFKAQLLFATNVRVESLADEALLRRILYKVSLPNPDRESFAEILRRVCRQRDIKVAEGALDYAVEKLFSQPGLMPRGAHARDILDILIESAQYDGREPILDREAFDRVFRLFVANETSRGETIEPAA
jgi:predicted ATPase with chaperone activity